MVSEIENKLLRSKMLAIALLFEAVKTETIYAYSLGGQVLFPIIESNGPCAKYRGYFIRMGEGLPKRLDGGWLPTVACKDEDGWAYCPVDFTLEEVQTARLPDIVDKITKSIQTLKVA